MWERYLAVDWGTTNRRAWLIGSGGRVLAQEADGLGVLQVAPGAFEGEVAGLRARLGDAPMLLAGMAGSNRGWREAPYVAVPAGLADLADAILWVDSRTAIVPGLMVERADGPDVMRGEEVQILGAVAAGTIGRDDHVCHPGTHAKWGRLEAGKIASFRTMMTGELFALLQQHSILAPELQGPANGDAFARGVADALSGADLLATLFSVRARAALGKAQHEAGYVSGLLIGCDVRAALRETGNAPLALIGRPDLCALYGQALAAAGQSAPQIDGEAAFLAGIHALVETVQ